MSCLQLRKCVSEQDHAEGSLKHVVIAADTVNAAQSVVH